MGRTVPLLSQAPNKLLQIFQSVTHVAILHEQNSDLRIIMLDGGPALPDSIRQWQGHSRGHWEGDTLVVESANYNGKWTLMGASAEMRVVERFKIRDTETLDYEFILDDPNSFGGPWTVAFPMTRAIGPVFENACHEGNHSMPLILSGARAADRRSHAR